MNEPRTPVIDFDGWADSLVLTDPEEKILASKAAETLLKQDNFRRVMAQLERNVIYELVKSSPSDKDLILDLKARLFGIRALKQSISVLADQRHTDARLAQHIKLQERNNDG